MSTVAPSTTSPPSPITKLKMDDKQHRLVRTTSMDKIKRFNTFICSQQYVVLPALLSWLKYPQSSLQASTEHTILLFRSVSFNIVRKFLGSGFAERCHSFAKRTDERDLSNLLQSGVAFCRSEHLLGAVVYASFVLLLLQLSVLVYTMCVSLMPGGFVFLLGCMLTIKYLFYKTACFYSSTTRKCHIK